MSEATTIFQKIADSMGLPAIAVEVGFLLLLTALLLVLILMVLAILRVRKEAIRMNYTATYIAGLLNQGQRNIQAGKIAQGYYDFKPDEWREDSKFIVLEMLQQGKSDNEIMNEIDVSPAYINKVRRGGVR
ncbi:MAG: hypothetical protein PVG87_16195 [Desulfobacteraceae bacterium]